MFLFEIGMCGFGELIFLVVVVDSVVIKLF